MVISLSLLWEKYALNIMSSYVLQIELDKKTKMKIWEDMDSRINLVQEIPRD